MSLLSGKPLPQTVQYGFWKGGDKNSSFLSSFWWGTGLRLGPRVKSSEWPPLELRTPETGVQVSTGQLLALCLSESDLSLSPKVQPV